MAANPERHRAVRGRQQPERRENSQREQTISPQTAQRQCQNGFFPGRLFQKAAHRNSRIQRQQPGDPCVPYTETICRHGTAQQQTNAGKEAQQGKRLLQFVTRPAKYCGRCQNRHQGRHDCRQTEKHPENEKRNSDPNRFSIQTKRRKIVKNRGNPQPIGTADLQVPALSSQPYRKGKQEKKQRGCGDHRPKKTGWRGRSRPGG